MALSKEQPETPRETANSTHQSDVQAGLAAAASAGNATHPAPPDPLIASPEEMRAFHDWLAARPSGVAEEGFLAGCGAYSARHMTLIADMDDPEGSSEPQPVPLSPFYNAQEVKHLEEEGVPPPAAREMGEAEAVARLGAEEIELHPADENQKIQTLGEGQNVGSERTQATEENMPSGPTALPATATGLGLRSGSRRFGGAKSAQKWENQLAQLGWTLRRIEDVIANGRSYPAVNKIHPANGATRYVDPQNGQSVVIDDKTGEILHVVGPGFKY